MAAEEPTALQMITGALGAGALLTALLVARQARWTLTPLDAAFWGLAVALFAARAVAGSLAQDKTGSARPSLRVIIGLAVASAVWLAAQALGDEPS